ncbi:MAG TPA: secondary thiamine-phosphate synthase enzyme YjbQ [Candidatus Aminicenantes bacterium]|nr:secondary thiamine-phosphate synthase enzyme YjbQ [Candidatus Aminicenantes bacterium]HRY64676.1 secondary thiamine-phosphate synthase enzyme YjbQ [Candidatus Aminicenantes bacterium]HRZ71589.1 secondary thiamine-phosphate synthase enzyme YjbQ [Candidatus Aminicenantes bacterium]
MNSIEIKTRGREDFVDLTAEIERLVAASGVKNGLCVVAVPHTTAGIAVNENADPDVRTDLALVLRKIAPDGLPYAHSEGNSPAHVKAALVGSSATLLVEDGRLRLGTWQGIFFCEFDGPRTRQAWVQIVG